MICKAHTRRYSRSQYKVQVTVIKTLKRHDIQHTQKHTAEANTKYKLQLSRHLERPINDNCKSEITQYSYHNNREHIDINHLPAILNKHIILVKLLYIVNMRS